MKRVGELLEEPTGHRSAADLEELEAQAADYDERQRRAFLAILERIGRVETRLGTLDSRLDAIERELVAVRRGRTRGGA